MRVNEDYATWNAAAQVGEKDSVFAFWKEALGVRKENDVLVCFLSIHPSFLDHPPHTLTPDLRRLRRPPPIARTSLRLQAHPGRSRGTGVYELLG